MRRVWRIFLNGLTIGSLLLCLAFAALWVRSYWRTDVIECVRHGRPDKERGFALVWSGKGGASIVIGFFGMSYGRLIVGPEVWSWTSSDDRPILYGGGWTRARWGFGSEPLSHPARFGRAVTFPLWLSTALFAVLPSNRLARTIRRRRRVRAGHCRKCGYDLRATPDLCPECGHIPSGASLARAV